MIFLPFHCFIWECKKIVFFVCLHKQFFFLLLILLFIFLSLSLSFCYLFIDKLKSENSKVLDNWPSLISKLQIERDLAQENAEYLSTLQEYFIVSINQPWLFCRVYYFFPFINRLDIFLSPRVCMPKGLMRETMNFFLLHPYCFKHVMLS